MYGLKRTILAMFSGVQQAEQAIQEIDANNLAKSGISWIQLAHRKEHREEFASELSLADQERKLQGMLVAGGKIAVPDLPPLFAAGPFAGELMDKPERGIAGCLADCGVDAAYAQDYQQAVKDGKTLVVISTDNSKVNEVANTLYSYGGREIQIWDHHRREPIIPHKLD